MSQKILIKKSTVVGKVPVSGDLDIGELAVNTADSHLYTKHSDNSVKKLTHTQNTDTSLDHGGANAVTAATITGHFATHPAPTTRDARNDPAGAAAGVQANLNTHTTTHPAPTTRDARNEAANANIQAHVTSAHAPSDAQKNVQSDWNQTTVGADDFIKNKPTISSDLFELDLNDDIMPTS